MVGLDVWDDIISASILHSDFVKMAMFTCPSAPPFTVLVSRKTKFKEKNLFTIF